MSFGGPFVPPGPLPAGVSPLPGEPLWQAYARGELAQAQQNHLVEAYLHSLAQGRTDGHAPEVEKSVAETVLLLFS